jgi:hypothetical protein
MGKEAVPATLENFHTLKRPSALQGFIEFCHRLRFKTDTNWTLPISDQNSLLEGGWEKNAEECIFNKDKKGIEEWGIFAVSFIHDLPVLQNQLILNQCATRVRIEDNEEAVNNLNIEIWRNSPPETLLVTLLQSIFSRRIT